MTTRREFVLALGGTALAARRVVAQQGTVPGATMAGDGYVPVRLPAKPESVPRMDALARDAVERQISCPCPCTLDVFTCRTSMPCGFSPRMHADVVSLAEGRYSGDEILAAFEQAYGEKILMAPHKRGFNWVGWIAPFAAVGGGGAVAAMLIRQWGRRAAEVRRAAPMRIDASAEELGRLEAAVRGEDR